MMGMIQKNISGDNEQLQAKFSLVIRRDGIQYASEEVGHRKERELCIHCNWKEFRDYRQIGR